MRVGQSTHKWDLCSENNHSPELGDTSAGVRDGAAVLAVGGTETRLTRDAVRARPLRTRSPMAAFIPSKTRPTPVRSVGWCFITGLRIGRQKRSDNLRRNNQIA